MFVEFVFETSLSVTHVYFLFSCRMFLITEEKNYSAVSLR